MPSTPSPSPSPDPPASAVEAPAPGPSRLPVADRSSPMPRGLLALLQGGVRQAVLVIVAYSVINLLIQSLLQPKFVGDAVGLSVTLTFLSLVFWSYVIGPLGALLAVPLSLFVKALLVDADPASRWLVPLIDPGSEDRSGGKGSGR
jgi:hypothetical protein